jgi:arylsulfatase
LDYLPIHMKRSLLLLLLLCSTLSLMSAHAASASRPNILIILADDMGYSDAGCYGGDVRTPNLDSLAANGLRFTQFYNTARCWPSRAAILTGYYAQAVRRDAMPGVPGSGGRGQRPQWAPLLSQMLKPLGYRSYQSGKWHVDGKPTECGFDHSYVLDDHNRNFAPRNLSEDDKPLPPVKPGTGYYTTTAFADHAIKCLQEHAEKYADRPFFEYLAFTVPHFPLQAPAEDIARYKDKYLKGWDVTREERFARQKKGGIVNTTLSALEREVGPPYAFPAEIAKLGPGEINKPIPWTELTTVQREFQATKMAIHAAMVDRMDQEIGRVLTQVKAMGAMENTLVIFLSDNGASAEIMVRGDGNDLNAAPGSEGSFLCLGPGFSSASNTPFRRHKTWVHEGGIATPFIVQWPKGIAARGELRHNPGHLIDIVPTVLEIAGGVATGTWEGKPEPSAPGRSLVPVFAKDNTVPHDYLWWMHEANRALRVGDWKIVAAGKDSPWELYDLRTDRAESNNLAEKQPDRVKEMAATWEKHTEEFRALALKDLPEAATRPGAKKRGKSAEDN